MHARSAKALLSLLALAAVIWTGQAGAAVGDIHAIDGVWITSPRDNGSYVTVRIAPCSDDPIKRCGTVIDTHNGARADIVGDPILRDMAFEGEGRWGGGEIIRPGRGTRYRSYLQLTEKGLEVKGCVAGGLFCGGTLWTRQ
ncbi:MAG: DUF2147 domain-containing protein [Pseudomonadota bacterium]